PRFPTTAAKAPTDPSCTPAGSRPCGVARRPWPSRPATTPCRSWNASASRRSARCMRSPIRQPIRHRKPRDLPGAGRERRGSGTLGVMAEVVHDRYARRLGTLAVEVGANVAAGQDVFVLAMDVQQAPIGRAVAESAYEAGARYVTVLYWDQQVKRARLGDPPPHPPACAPRWR